VALDPIELDSRVKRIAPSAQFASEIVADAPLTLISFNSQPLDVSSKSCESKPDIAEDISSEYKAESESI
jgi:hypothetical protein